MAILTDYHTHSYFSGDCDTPMEHMIKQAVSLGMTHLCLTEHLDLDYPSQAGECLDFNLDTLQYRKEFLSLQEKYKHQIQLFWGVELGLQTHIFPDLHDYVQNHPFDFIIASSHLCNGEDPSVHCNVVINRSQELLSVVLPAYLFVFTLHTQPALNT